MKISLLPIYNLAKFRTQNSIKSPILTYSKDSVSFTHNISVETLTKEDYKKESEILEEIKTCNLNVRPIRPDGTYFIYGNKADLKSNPITDLHLIYIMNDILKLDTNDIYHGDLENGHIFYSNNGNIQIDCFRFGAKKGSYGDFNHDTSWQYPKEFGLSNLIDYENLSLGYYLNQMHSESTKNAFIEKYLKLSSNFHNKKAQFLRQKNAPQEQIDFEEIQAKLYKNPSKDIINLTKKRIEFKYNERLGFTKIDEGQGACNHDPNEKDVAQGILIYFDSWVQLQNYKKELAKAKNRIESNNELKLLNYYEIYANHWDNNYQNMVCGNACWKVNPRNPEKLSFTNVSIEEHDKYKEFCDKIRNLTDINKKIFQIKKAKKIFQKYTR